MSIFYSLPKNLVKAISVSLGGATLASTLTFANPALARDMMVHKETPGGSLDTDVIIRLVYVETNKDVSQLAEKYITEAKRIASTS